jgi:hypothetical protein
MAIALVSIRWTFFLILKGQHLRFLDFLKNVCPPLEIRLLVMWEGIGKAPREVLHIV